MITHRCSVGDKTHEHAGHGNMLILLALSGFCMILAVWDLCFYAGK